jgi:hypothetical protein
MEADCDSNHHLVIAEVRESERSTQKIDVERFSLKKLNEVGGNKQCQVKI